MQILLLPCLYIEETLQVVRGNLHVLLKNNEFLSAQEQRGPAQVKLEEWRTRDGRDLKRRWSGGRPW